MVKKLKIGDTVKIRKDSEYYGESDSNPKNVKGMIRNVYNSTFCYEVKWNNGNINDYEEGNLELITKPNKKQKNMTEQNMKQTVETVARELAKINGAITTLELKNELRANFPTIMWNQYTTGNVPGVSNMFHELVAEGKFYSIADNGTYQTYVPASFTIKAGPALTVGNTKGMVKGSAKALAAGAKAAATRAANKGVTSTGTKITRSKALDLMKSNKGHFFTVVFVEKDGTVRKLNGQYVKDQKISPLGYVLVKESSKLKAGQNAFRNVNIQTLSSLKIGGVAYSVK